MFVATVSSAATLVVDPSGAGDFMKIQAAIDAATDGDEVLVRPGEYVITESLDFNRLHDPEDPGSPPVKDIVLRSDGGAESLEQFCRVVFNLNELVYPD